MTLILPSRAVAQRDVPLLFRAADCIDDLGVFALGYGGRVAGTFTRSGRGVSLDQRDRLVTLPPGMPRVGAMQGRPVVLIEPAATQLCTQPQTPASWSNLSSPIVTTGVVDPWGGSAATMVEDDDPGNQEGRGIVVSFTGDGTKSVLFCVRQGTLGRVQVGLRDTTVNENRHYVGVTFNGAAAPSLQTASGAGRIGVPYSIVDREGHAWWMIGFAVDGVVAANTNRLTLLGYAADTGTVYFAGANAWDSDRPFSWQSTSGHARLADNLRLPVPQAIPGDVTLYAAGFPCGAEFVSGSDFTTGRIVALGTSGSGWKLSLRHSPTHNGAAISGLIQGPGGGSEQAVGTPLLPSTVRPREFCEYNLRVRTGTDGATSQTVAQLGEEVTQAFGTGNLTVPPTAWATGELLVRGGVDCYGWAFTHLCYAVGLRSIDEMRALAGV